MRHRVSQGLAAFKLSGIFLTKLQKEGKNHTQEEIESIECLKKLATQRKLYVTVGVRKVTLLWLSQQEAERARDSRPTTQAMDPY